MKYMVIVLRNEGENVHVVATAQANMHISAEEALDIVIPHLSYLIKCKLELYIQAFNEYGYPSDNLFRSLAIL